MSLCVQNLLSKVLDRTPAIEAVNMTGGRLIREGKVIISGIVMFNSMLVSLIGSLSLRCECLHEWSFACVLHTYRSHYNHYFYGFRDFQKLCAR